MIYKCMMLQKPNVHFVLKNGNKNMKIPAHKELLAVSSPVFNAMFNGELKEKGDVRIVDASYEAFKEFLQFFYKNKVKLTMGNIVEVLNLVNKYDIAVGSKIVSHFLIENLTSDRILWGLHLAVKYQLKNLEDHCKTKMADDATNVLDILKYKSDGGKEDESALSTKNHLLSDTELASILPKVLMVAKDVISNHSMRRFIPDSDSDSDSSSF